MYLNVDSLVKLLWALWVYPLEPLKVLFLTEEKAMADPDEIGLAMTPLRDVHLHDLRTFVQARKIYGLDG